jgi:O-antigen/teichoic acid export membrane protein
VPKNARAKSVPAQAGGSELGRKAMNGLAMMLGQNIVGRACGMLSQLALAAILRPEDFGIVGLASTVSALAASLVNFGVEDVVLQRHLGLRLWVGPALWISLGLSVVAAALTAGAAPTAAAIYAAPEVGRLLVVTAIAMPLGALSTVPAMVLRAKLQFKVLAAYGTGELLAQALLTIGFAWFGFGALSFVLPLPITAAVRAGVLWRLAEVPGSLRPRVRRWKHILGNTHAAFATRLITSVMSQADYVLLGLLATKQATGLYYFGYRLAAQPLWILAGNLSGVVFPALAQLRPEPVRQGEAALHAATLLSYCVLPLGFIQAAIAAPVVEALFGSQWRDAIPIIQLLSVGLAFDAVSWITGSLLNARGEFRLTRRYALLQMPLFFLAIVVGVWLGGAQGVAAGICLFYVVTQPAITASVFYRAGVTARVVVRLYVAPTLMGAAATGLGLVAGCMLPARTHGLVAAALIAAVSAAAYAALLRGIAPQIWRQLGDRLGSTLRRRAV